MKGRRVTVNDEGNLLLAPGDYGKYKGVWYARPPSEKIHMGSLAEHSVTEHEDNTISVTPSILIQQGEQSWHGFLKRGVWSECG